MKTVIRFVVRYPHASTAITRTELSSSFLPAYNPTEIYADTWAKAHEFLCSHAEQRVAKAQRELDAANAHLAAARALQKPENA